MEILFIIIVAIAILALPALVHKSSSESDTMKALESVSNFSKDLVRLSWGGTSLGIDPDNNLVVFVDNNMNTSIFNFADIVGVEVSRDGQSLVKVNRGGQVGGAVVGAAILGPVGLLIGGLSGSKRTEEFVSRLSLKIYTSDLHSPVQEIVFHEGTKMSINGMAYRSVMNEVDRWYGRFMVIVERGSSGTVHSQIALEKH